jgi:hypothetical protein
MTMALVIVRHKVKDFAAWKQVFDAHAPARGAAGLSNTRLYQSVDDPSEVVILFDTDDIAKAQQFIGSADLKSAMTAAGVIDKPDVFILNAASEPDLPQARRSG